MGVKLSKLPLKKPLNTADEIQNPPSYVDERGDSSDKDAVLSALFYFNDYKVFIGDK